MKKTVVAFAVCAVAAGAFADLKIDLGVGFGIYNNTGSAGIVPQEAGQEMVFQLYSVGLNGEIDYAAPAGKGGDITGTAGDGDDLLIDSGSFFATGSFDFSDYGLGAAIRVVGDYTAPVYARVIGAGLDGITAGDWYFQSATFVPTDITDPKALPDGVNVDGGVAVNADFGQVIPEPATIGLMGIAGLGMYLARRKARR